MKTKESTKKNRFYDSYSSFVSVTTPKIYKFEALEDLSKYLAEKYGYDEKSAIADFLDYNAHLEDSIKHVMFVLDGSM